MSLQKIRNSVWVVLSFLIVACQPATHNSVNEEVPVLPTSVTVTIKQMRFQPEKVEIRQGDTVIWVNEDMVAHNVAEENGTTILSDTIVPHASWKMVPTKSFNYICSIHPTMKGEIEIAE
jgi:plastocyanin